MTTVILTYQNAHLTPEARWLLMQWASIIGLEKSVECSLKTLFDRLGMTYAQGRRAWDVLIGKEGQKHKQFVQIERLPSKGPGRPASRYRLSSKLMKALAATPSPPNHHAEEIATLAKTTRAFATQKNVNLADKSRGRRSGLTLPNRWLLMVLLAHAESPGMVSRLSVSEIHRLTGMSRFRINSQLKKLMDLRFIAHYQPGNFSRQASARRTSVYLLNLAHPLVKSDERDSLIAHLPTSRPDLNQTCVADGIIDAVMTVGVCSLQIDALSEKYDTFQASDRRASDDNGEETTQRHDSYRVAKSYQEKFDRIKGVRKHAEALLPTTRYLVEGSDELLNNYDATDASWLLTAVHADAMLLLSTSWNALKEGRLGPDDPNPEIIGGIARRLGLTTEGEAKCDAEEDMDADAPENTPCTHDAEEKERCGVTQAVPVVTPTPYPPLSILFYALSHHLATCLQNWLCQLYAKDHENIDYASMVFILVPIFPNQPNKGQVPVLQLRGYPQNLQSKKHLPKYGVYREHADWDLKTYWRTHHQKCLPANNSELEEAVQSCSERSRP